MLIYDCMHGCACCTHLLSLRKVEVSAALTKSGIQTLIYRVSWHEACLHCVSCMDVASSCLLHDSEIQNVLLVTVQKKVRTENWVDSLGEDIHSRLGITGGNQVFLSTVCCSASSFS